MSRLPLLLLFIGCLSGQVPARCQDVIFKKSGDSIISKVLRVQPYSVDYKLIGGADTSVRSLNKSYIRYILYKNGTSDTFKVSDVQPDPGATNNRDEAGSHIYKGSFYASTRLSDNGTQDAHMYYKGYRSVKRKMAISAILFPYSLISTAIVATTPPKENNLQYPFPDLMLKPEYRNAYEEEAYHIKKKQTWKGYWNGCGIILGIYVVGFGLLLAAYNHH